MEEEERQPEEEEGRPEEEESHSEEREGEEGLVGEGGGMGERGEREEASRGRQLQRIMFSVLLWVRQWGSKYARNRVRQRRGGGKKGRGPRKGGEKRGRRRRGRGCLGEKFERGRGKESNWAMMRKGDPRDRGPT